MSQGLDVAGNSTCKNRRCQVVKDVATGWDDYCMGLLPLEQSVTKTACQAACCSDPDCEVWQWSTKRSERDSAMSSLSADTVMTCLTGKGFECQSVRTDDFVVYAGQRVTHGTKLKENVWCTGNGMKKTAFAQGTSHANKLQQCRSACFLDEKCHVWQYSTLRGCWSGSTHLSGIRCFEDFSLRGTIMGGEVYNGACESHLGKETNYVFVYVTIGIAAVVLLLLSIIFLAIDWCRGPPTPEKAEKQETPRHRGRGRIAVEEEQFGQLDPASLSRLSPPQGVYQAVSQNGSNYSPASGSFNSTPEGRQGSFSFAPSTVQSLQMGLGGSEPGQPGPPRYNDGVINPKDASFGQQTISSQASSFSGTPLLFQKEPLASSGVGPNGF